MDQKRIMLLIRTREGVHQYPLRVSITTTIQELIDDIVGKLCLSIEATYRIRPIEEVEGLNPKKTLGWHNVKENDQFFFEPEKKREDLGTLVNRLTKERKRYPIRSDIRAYLREERSQTTYDLEWQPAVIGRRDRNFPEKNFLLAVDLTGRPGAKSVSRRHAGIRYENGQYYIEIFNTTPNPTFVGNMRLEAGDRQDIQPGDRIRIGSNISLTFNLRG